MDGPGGASVVSRGRVVYGAKERGEGEPSSRAWVVSGRAGRVTREEEAPVPATCLVLVTETVEVVVVVPSVVATVGRWWSGVGAEYGAVTTLTSVVIFPRGQSATEGGQAVTVYVLVTYTVEYGTVVPGVASAMVSVVTEPTGQSVTVGSQLVMVCVL